MDETFQAAKAAQKAWARTPLWKRADYLHKAAALMRENAQPMADVLVKEVAKGSKDALTEVIRSVRAHTICVAVLVLPVSRRGTAACCHAHTA